MITSDRLKLVIEYLKFKESMKTQKDVAKAIGFSQSNLSSALQGSKKYLTDGLVDKINSSFPNISKSWMLEGVGSMVLSSSMTESIPDNQVLLLPVYAQGGTLNDFATSLKEHDCEKIISPIKGAEYAIVISGDSMAPEYPGGSQVLIKRVNENAFLDWGRAYVLDTCNGIVVKQLFPSEDKEKVLCKSINPDYPPFEVSLKDIYGIYRVLLCMSLK